MILFLLFTIFSSPMASSQICRDLFYSCANCTSTEAGTTAQILGLNNDSSPQQSIDLHQLQQSLMTLGWASSKSTTAFNKKLDAALKANSQKMNDPFFSEYMKLWSEWHSLMTAHIESVSRMPKVEQNKFRKKLEPLIHFSTEHYFVFLNTKNRDFNYSRILSLLKTATATPESTNNLQDLTFLIYSFEKNIRRFSSEKEFKNCR